VPKLGQGENKYFFVNNKVPNYQSFKYLVSSFRSGWLPCMAAVHSCRAWLPGISAGHISRAWLPVMAAGQDAEKAVFSF
jgi:hypothetical protein